MLTSRFGRRHHQLSWCWSGRRQRGQRWAVCS